METPLDFAFKFDQFGCDSLVNNFGDDLKYQVIFLDEDYPQPLSDDELLMLLKFKYH